MLTELDRSAGTLSGELAADDGTVDHYDQHTADAANELVDRDREEAMLESVGDQRRQVVAALARLDDGSYGRCVDCGEPLDEERLDARPEAARCLADQEKVEAHR